MTTHLRCYLRGPIAESESDRIQLVVVCSDRLGLKSRPDPVQVQAQLGPAAKLAKAKKCGNVNGLNLALHLRDENLIAVEILISLVLLKVGEYEVMMCSLFFLLANLYSAWM